METLRICTHLSADIALRDSRTEYGKSYIVPTAEELLALTADERVELRLFNGGNPLQIEQPDWAGVLAAVRTRLDSKFADRRRLAAEAAARQASIDAELDSYRAILAAGRYYEPGLPLVQVEHHVAWANAPNYSRDNQAARALWAQIEEAREAERITKVREADDQLGEPLKHVNPDGTVDEATQLVLAAARVYRNGQDVDWPDGLCAHAARDVAKAVKERRNEEREATEREAAKVFVLAHVPEYARAATEGCDVRHRATECVVAWLVDVLDARVSYSDELHTCPSAKAYQAHDETRAALARSPGGALSEATLTLTRSDICKRRGHKTIRTCVHIECALPWGGEIDLVALAESEPEDEPEDES